MRTSAEHSRSGSRTLAYVLARIPGGSAVFPQRLREDTDAPSLAVVKGSKASEQQRRERTMSWNDDLVANVNDELFWDPKVDNAAIAVTADKGAITLRGTVGSLREKREAKKAAQRVFGVISVDDKLQVRLLDSSRRADADLRGDVLRAMSLDSLVPQSVDAKVSDGFVTLSGAVDWQFQRDEADYVASNIVGLLDVFNEIEIRNPTPNSYDVKASIKKALKRNAGVDGDGLSVTTDNGTVTISGTVRSWSEHDEAIDAAWAAPGVTSVRDGMAIAY
jgi:osmotically-inducible protein OsmY